MADTGQWQDGTDKVGPVEGEFMTLAQKVRRETAACQSAINDAYAEYQRQHDGILRAYWAAMRSITAEAEDATVTQVVPSIDWNQQAM